MLAVLHSANWIRISPIGRDSKLGSLYQDTETTLGLKILRHPGQYGWAPGQSRLRSTYGVPAADGLWGTLGVFEVT